MHRVGASILLTIVSFLTDMQNQGSDWEKETSIDNMGDTLLIAMQECIKQDRQLDALAIMNEWVIDGVADPCDGNYEFMFINNLTLN